MKKRKTENRFNGCLYCNRKKHIHCQQRVKNRSIKNGEFVEKILNFTNTYSQIEGIAHINNDESELVINLGIIRFEKDQLKDSDYTNRFVQRRIILKTVSVIQNLSFLEFVTFNDLTTYLRPVIKICSSR